MQTTFVCACCGRLRPRSERVTIGADALCWSCSGCTAGRDSGTMAAHSVRRALNKSITIETA